MKKRIISIICVIAIVLSSAFVITKVTADSGWDSSFDSGGSDWGGSSDWGSSSWGGSSGSYGGSYSGGSIDFEFLIIIIFIMIFLSALKSKNNHAYVEKGSHHLTKKIYSDLDDITKLGMTKDEFKKYAFNTYKDIQLAWMNFDYDELRKLTTDEIYNSYKMQLETLKLKNQQNVMSDFEFIDAKIFNITEVNGVINVSIYLNVKMYDYVINKAGKVLRGTNKNKINIEYEITFVKTSKEVKDTTCPNCGAPIDLVASADCEYCGSTIVVDAKKFVMSKKTCVGQRRG